MGDYRPSGLKNIFKGILAKNSKKKTVVSSDSRGCQCHNDSCHCHCNSCHCGKHSCNCEQSCDSNSCKCECHCECDSDNEE